LEIENAVPIAYRLFSQRRSVSTLVLTPRADLDRQPLLHPDDGLPEVVRLPGRSNVPVRGRDRRRRPVQPPPPSGLRCVLNRLFERHVHVNGTVSRLLQRLKTALQRVHHERISIVG
jgi:hypothetical protein